MRSLFFRPKLLYCSLVSSSFFSFDFSAPIFTSIVSTGRAMLIAAIHRCIYVVYIPTFM